MMGDFNSSRRNIGAFSVANTPDIKEYHEDGTVSVSVEDAYALHKSAKRRYNLKRHMRRMPVVAIMLVIMLITPVVLIKATSTDDSNAKAEAPTSSTQKATEKAPSAKPTEQKDIEPTGSPAASTSAPVAATSTQTVVAKKRAVKKTVIKKKNYKKKTIASTSRAGQSIVSTSGTSTGSTVAASSTTTSSTTSATSSASTAGKPAAKPAKISKPKPAVKKPQKASKKPVQKKPAKKQQKPKQQIGTSVKAASKPKTPAKQTKPQKSAGKKSKPAAKPAPKSKKPAKKKRISKKTSKSAAYVGGPSRFVDYNQGDWGSRIASSGCGPTSAAMVVSSLTNKRVNPRQMSGVLTPKYYIPGSGTRQEAATFHYIAKRFNLRYSHPKNYAEITKVLRSGGLVIVYAKPGHFTGAGHFMVIKKVSKDGKRFVLADPNGAPGRDSEKRHWTAEQLRQGGVVDFWGFTPRR